MDFATDAVSFLHRVGRTGRLGSYGKVTSFVRDKDLVFANKITEVIEKNQNLDHAFNKKKSLWKNSRKKNDDYDSDDSD